MTNFYRKSEKNAYQIGLEAERLAIQYLTEKDWSILNYRYRCPFGEIDLIAIKKEWLLFIEVKARQYLNDAIYALKEKQKNRLIKAASYFLDTNDLPEIRNIRFDLIAISADQQVTHIENITVL